MINALIKFFLENKLVTFLLVILFILWGWFTAPFDWNMGGIDRDPVAVDAIPDIGENQQIIYTEWMGKSPTDVENQITYPLTTALLGMPGVTSIRSTSMFGLSFVSIIFEDKVDYYWSRSRVLEKLNALSPTLLPEGVQPQLGPDATALGQVFWYTIEGRDENGKPAGGWDPHEIRSVQDFYIKYGLSAAEGVSEVASIGGFVKEYQVDLNPVAMKAHNVSMMQVMNALRQSNLDIGANTVEINLVEYYVRGLGYVKNIEDIAQSVVAVNSNIPIRIKDVAQVSEGPAPRGHAGFLDKGGAEAVGGVVVARYGENPLKVIANVKKKIEEISVGLPTKTLIDGSVSKLTIVPFYDRTQLIYETLGTLNEAIFLQILITIIVIVVMVFHLRASLMISALLPLAVLMCFVMMRHFGIDANIVALSGIAIAIGTMVDLGIILSENILRHQKEAPEGQSLTTTIYNAVSEVSSAIITAVSTTIISFLPVFTLQAAEGKLFSPLAYTKTFALVAALLITLFMMPTFAHWLFRFDLKKGLFKKILYPIILITGIFGLNYSIWGGLALIGFGLNGIFIFGKKIFQPINIGITVLAVSWVLAESWMPLGASNSILINFLFVGVMIGLLLGTFSFFLLGYSRILNYFLKYKLVFLIGPVLLLFLGTNIWLGYPKVFGKIVKSDALSKIFPGMGREFMPSLDEGSFLLMPTSMPHSGVEVNMQYLKQLDLRVQAIPEVEMVVGKAGRVESALDPAPISMFENIILYKSEFKTDKNGKPLRFKIDDRDSFLLDEVGNLIEDPKGKFFRQWRDEIQAPSDIWKEIQKATSGIPGVTSAPKLQPIETRLVMLQTGMRAPMGIKVFGPDLERIEKFSLDLERILKDVPSVNPAAVYADRSLGKPYLEIDLDRKALARFGLSVAEVQDYIEMAVGGMSLTTTIEGRERYGIRARYPREGRDNPESIEQILIPAGMEGQIPLGQLARVEYKKGPMMIRGENSFLVGYVLLDKKEGYAEGNVVNEAQQYLADRIELGELNVPPGVSFKFSGTYENQIRAEKRLLLVVPLVLAAIFLILYFQFKSVSISMMIFSGIALAFSGGFIMLWLYGQPWFMDFSIFQTNIRELFQMKNFNLSVAVWVGFIALFGIATDDGVVMSTYLQQSFEKNKPTTVQEVRQAVLEAGLKRVRPCLMTTATTILALLPVLTSSGRGSDIMIPMAIPAFGGMALALITLFLVPVLYSFKEEMKIK
jgi:copper/silver efflux system protein